MALFPERNDIYSDDTILRFDNREELNEIEIESNSAEWLYFVWSD